MEHTTRDVLTMMFAVMPALRWALVAVAVAATAEFVLGRAVVGAGLVALVVVLTALVLLQARKGLRNASGQQTWAIDADGVRLASGVADTRVAWSSVRSVVAHRRVVLLRTPTALLGFPRRAATPEQLERVGTWASAAGVAPVRGLSS